MATLANAARERYQEILYRCRYAAQPYRRDQDLPPSVTAAQEKTLSLSDANTRIVPDEGEPGSTAVLRVCQDALVEIRTRVQKLIDEGKSEDEAVAAKPTNDLEAKWVRPGGFLSGDTYTRMAYQSLKSENASAAR